MRTCPNFNRSAMHIDDILLVRPRRRPVEPLSNVALWHNLRSSWRCCVADQNAQKLKAAL